jgi:hypothetical protein
MTSHDDRPSWIKPSGFDARVQPAKSWGLQFRERLTDSRAARCVAILRSSQGKSPVHTAAGSLLFILSGVVLVLTVLAAGWKIVPERSYLGIGITLGALFIMPSLAILKRRHANTTEDSALAADAVQSATFAYLAAITLASLLLQTVHPLWWIDPIAVVCLIPLLLIEGRRAWRGEACGCC